MSKKYNKKETHAQQHIVKEKVQEEAIVNDINNINTSSDGNSWLAKITSVFIPYIIFTVVGITIFANTFKHEFALDDDIVICNNEYVLQGVSAIPKILSEDAFSSFFRWQNLSDTSFAARYRPLSYVTFAIEQQFIKTFPDGKIPKDVWDVNKNGKQDIAEDVNKDGLYNDKDFKVLGTSLRHIVNCLLFILCVCVVYYLLHTYLFPEHKAISFFAALLFLVHPIHTEAIDNIKSRDEILSLLFIILTLISVFKYYYNQTNKNLLWVGLNLFLAFLSKEYAVIMIGLIPVTLYLFTEGEGWKKVKKLYLACIGSLALYATILLSISNKLSDNLGTELLNNPYLRADDGERIATKVYSLLRYIVLLFVPHPLRCDYGYPTFEYRNFASWDFWVAIIIYGGLVYFMYKALKTRNKYFYGIVVFLFFLFPVSNIVFTLPLTIAERLMFHASLGFCILVPSLLVYYTSKNSKLQLQLCMLLFIPCIVFALLTINRNPAWKNDETLALTDIKTEPQSLLLMANASARCIEISELPKNKNIEQEYLQKAINYGVGALKIHPEFANANMNLGLAYFKRAQYDSAEHYWKIAQTVNPSNPKIPQYFDILSQMLFQEASKCGNVKDWAGGMKHLAKIVQLQPKNAKYWYDYGGFSYNAGQLAIAKFAWDKAFEINPNDAQIQKVHGIIK